MPRLYLTPNDFLLTPESIAWSSQIARLTALGTGAIDRLLVRASSRVDSFCKKRIGAMGSTTLSGAVSAGTQQISVASTLGYDDRDEQAVLIGTGATQETVAIAPGGVAVSTWSAPYPGTLTLATPLAFSHLQGETVQGCYREVSRSGSSDNNEPYSEALLTQEAQIAQAHAPALAQGKNLTRKVLTKQYPILSILAIEHAYPFAPATYSPLNPQNIGINPQAGIYTFTLGTVVIPEGLLRTTYLAGYQTVPDEVVQATMWYAGDVLQTIASQGAYETQQGKRRVKWGQQGKSLYEQRAENLLLAGNFKRTV